MGKKKNAPKPDKPTKTGKAGTKRLKGRPAQRRRAWEPTARQMEIFELAHRGDIAQTDIAKQFGITQGRVSQICRKINEWLVPQYMDTVRAMKSEHTRRLLWMYSEAMQAWERSKLDAETVKTGTSEKGSYSATEIKGQVGNVAYLEQARQILGDIRKIWGADAPLQVEHTHMEDRVAGRSIEDVVAEKIGQLKERLKQPAIPHVDSGDIIDVEPDSNA